MTSLPPTRWERSQHGYGAAFAARIAAGEDVFGEARLADALVPRSARILDAGSGMGRIGAALRDRGHQAVGVDLDQELIEQSRATYPQFPVLQRRLDVLTAADLAAAGLPTEYDLILSVGNVMIMLAPDSEVVVLSSLRALLAPAGRLLLGFSTDASKPGSRLYSREELIADAAAAGLSLESAYSSYDLRPFDPAANYLVALLIPA